MRITLQQAADILNRTEDEVLFISLHENRLESHQKMDNDIVYNEDGTVRFVEGDRDPSWEFNLEDVLSFKKEMEEGLVGEVEDILDRKF
jgi:hypothetical protein